jgi:flagellar motor protein MotB
MPLERRKPQQAENDDTQWLTAYADLISAVLAVVVLMLTFAPVNLDELTTAVMKQEPST